MNIRKLSINKACVFLGVFLLLAAGFISAAVYVLTRNTTAVWYVLLFSLFVLLCVICFVALIRRKLAHFSDAFCAMLDDMLSVVNKALAGFDAMRTTEGKALENDLRSRGQTILSLVSQVEAGGAQTVLDYRTRLENKIKEVLASTAIDESRILTEAAIFADKVAVDEETVRLRSHLEQMNNMLTTGGAVGRKLDFLLQEMNREANTIGSKCTDVRLARVVVEIKAELEKIREQTQNIE